MVKNRPSYGRLYDFCKKQSTATSHFLRGRLYSVLLNLYFICCKTFRMGIGETSPTSNLRRMARREIRENEQTCTGLHCLPKSTPLKQHIQILWCFLIYAIQISSYVSMQLRKKFRFSTVTGYISTFLRTG